MAICGIYKITNKVNGKVYIGQSIDIERRWKTHLLNAKNEVQNVLLYQAFQKYGIENFDFSIIEEIPEEKLNEREQYWIRYYNSYIGFTNHNGYNMTLGADGSRGVNCLSKEVEQYDFDGNFIQNFLSVGEAAKKLNIDHSLISACCNKRRKSTGGFQFIYKGEEPPGPYVSKAKKRIGLYNSEGELLQIYDSILDASNAFGCSRAAISNNLCHKTSTTLHGIWKYIKK